MFELIFGLMTLIHSPHLYTSCQGFGSRNISIFEVLHNNISSDLENDPDVQTWFKAIKNDPIVKVTSVAARCTNQVFMNTLSGFDSILNFSLYPLTYPISKTFPKENYVLTECPFPASPPITISGSGDIAPRNNNFIDNFQLRLKNIANSLESSKSFVVRNGFKITRFLFTAPLNIRFFNSNKEHTVLTAIDHYFPTFNGPDFCDWMEDSFLPSILSYYICGKTTPMKEIADVGIVQERQVQIASLVSMGHQIKSRLLSVSNAEIIDYDFRNNAPALSVKCNTDSIEHVVDKSGKIVFGGPENIKRSEVLVQMIVNTEGNLPKWKAYEIRIASVNDRI